MDDAARKAGIDDILLALGDPTRRAILARLSKGAARVTEVAAPFDISLNSVSKHIRILERADLVVRFQAGREHLLTLNPAPLKKLEDWLGETGGRWTGKSAAAAKPLKPKQSRASAKARPKRSRAKT